MYKGPRRKFKRKAAKQRRMSEYAFQFSEKQKLKALFGLREKDLKNYYLKAKKNRQATEDVLCRLLESRLDNAIYRLGWAKTRYQARQIANHGHILLNDKKVNIPSIQLKPKDKLTIKPSSRKSPLFANLKEILTKHNPPVWLKRSEDYYSGEVLTLPGAADFTEPVDIKLIVEFYNR